MNVISWTWERKPLDTALMRVHRTAAGTGLTGIGTPVQDFAPGTVAEQQNKSFRSRRKLSRSSRCPCPSKRFYHALRAMTGLKAAGEEWRAAAAGGSGNDANGVV